jgi:hypothetical protein
MLKCQDKNVNCTGEVRTYDITTPKGYATPMYEEFGHFPIPSEPRTERRTLCLFHLSLWSDRGVNAAVAEEE